MYGQSEEALLPLRIPDLDRAIPAAREECVLVHQIPVHRKHFSSMLLPARDRELAHPNVKQFYASIASSSEKLVLVLFGPGEVEEAVLGLEEFLADDALGGQIKDVQPSIANETEVCDSAHGEERVEERRVLDDVWVEAGGAELEHLDGLGYFSSTPEVMYESRTYPTVEKGVCTWNNRQEVV